jgi:carbamoyl-phosphate synthase small subunit
LQADRHAPHIGNVGANAEDFESRAVYAAGLIIRDRAHVDSNFRSETNLGDYLRKHDTVAIADIDTRKLTRILRTTGAQNGCIMTAKIGETIDVTKAIAAAKSAPSMAGLDLAKVVSCVESYDWTDRLWSLKAAANQPKPVTMKYHVVAFDYGVKHNILRHLAERGCKVTVLPAQATAQQALALKPDGVFLSNGPGDPEPCDYAIKAIAEIVETGTPTFGICLGHQLLALASGAKTMKMKFGHHGANHPVQDLDTKRVYITSQNHGFAVDETNMPKNVRATHRSLFDGSLQGIERTDKPAFSFQGHPEASPGPHEMDHLFDRFVTMMQAMHESKK